MLNQKLRGLIVFLLDLFAMIVAVIGSYLIRFNFEIPAACFAAGDSKGARLDLILTRATALGARWADGVARADGVGAVTWRSFIWIFVPLAGPLMIRLTC